MRIQSEIDELRAAESFCANAALEVDRLTREVVCVYPHHVIVDMLLPDQLWGILLPKNAEGRTPVEWHQGDLPPRDARLTARPIVVSKMIAEMIIERARK